MINLVDDEKLRGYLLVGPDETADIPVYCSSQTVCPK